MLTAKGHYWKRFKINFTDKFTVGSSKQTDTYLFCCFQWPFSRFRTFGHVICMVANIFLLEQNILI